MDVGARISSAAFSYNLGEKEGRTRNQELAKTDPHSTYLPFGQSAHPQRLGVSD